MFRPPTLCKEIIQSSIIELSYRLNPALILILHEPDLETDLIYLVFYSNPRQLMRCFTETVTVWTLLSHI